MTNIKVMAAAVLFLGIASGAKAECDYSNADDSRGWGWDQETRESCPPIGEEPVSQQSRYPACINPALSDLDGDGFGWEQGETCLVEENNEPVEENNENEQIIPTSRPLFNLDGTYYCERALLYTTGGIYWSVVDAEGIFAVIDGQNISYFDTYNNFPRGEATWNYDNNQMTFNGESFAQIGFFNIGYSRGFHLYYSDVSRLECKVSP